MGSKPKGNSIQSGGILSQNGFGIVSPLFFLPQFDDWYYPLATQCWGSSKPITSYQEEVLVLALACNHGTGLVDFVSAWLPIIKAHKITKHINQTYIIIDLLGWWIPAGEKVMSSNSPPAQIWYPIFVRATVWNIDCRIWWGEANNWCQQSWKGSFYTRIACWIDWRRRLRTKLNIGTSIWLLKITIVIVNRPKHAC